MASTKSGMNFMMSLFQTTLYLKCKAQLCLVPFFPGVWSLRLLLFVWLFPELHDVTTNSFLGWSLDFSAVCKMSHKLAVLGIEPLSHSVHYEICETLESKDLLRVKLPPSEYCEAKFTNLCPSSFAQTTNDPSFGFLSLRAACIANVSPYEIVGLFKSNQMLCRIYVFFVFLRSVMLYHSFHYFARDH